MVLLPWTLGSLLRFFVPFFGLGLQGFQTRKHRLASQWFKYSQLCWLKTESSHAFEKTRTWSYQGILLRCLRVCFETVKESVQLNVHVCENMRKLGFQTKMFWDTGGPLLALVLPNVQYKAQLPLPLRICIETGPNRQSKHDMWWAQWWGKKGIEHSILYVCGLYICVHHISTCPCVMSFNM